MAFTSVVVNAVAFSEIRPDDLFLIKDEIGDTRFVTIYRKLIPGHNMVGDGCDAIAENWVGEGCNRGRIKIEPETLVVRLA